MSRPLAITLTVVGTCGAIILVCWLMVPRLNRHIERGKAENVALNRDPLVVARAAMSYIKRTGTVPERASDCVSISAQPADSPNHTSELRGLEWLEVEWPPRECDFVLRSVFDRIALSFPAHPDELTAQDGILVSRTSHEPAFLISIEGIDPADRPGLRFANVELWRAWSHLVNGEATGIDWLDAYEPEPPAQP